MAAGVVYGLLIGAIHFSYLEICSSTQLSYIAQRIAELHLSGSATDYFSTQLVVFPIYFGLGALVLGVIYGAFYSLVYTKLPGSNSLTKGVSLGVLVFVLGYILDISGYEIGCAPSFIPYTALALSLPISIAYGYLLGIFYDSFGRYELERKKEV